MADFVPVSIPGPLEDQIDREFILATFDQAMTLQRVDLTLLVAPSGGTGSVLLAFKDLPGENTSLAVEFGDGEDVAHEDGEVQIPAGGQLALVVTAASGGAEDLTGTATLSPALTVPQPSDDDLVTLELVKVAGEIDAGTFDAILQTLISGVSKSFARWCRRPLAETLIEDEWHVGVGLPVLAAHYPIGALVEVKPLGGSAIDLSAFAIPSDPFQLGRALRRTDGGVFAARTEYQISYRSGWAADAIPADLQAACVEEVLIAWRQVPASGAGALGLAQQVLDTGGTTTYRERRFSGRTLEVLEPYRMAY